MGSASGRFRDDEIPPLTSPTEIATTSPTPGVKPVKKKSSVLKSLFGSATDEDIPESSSDCRGDKSKADGHALEGPSATSTSGIVSSSTRISDLVNFKSNLGGAKKAKPVRRQTISVKSEAYMEAIASDSINEIHPEKLSTFIQVIIFKKYS